MWLSLLPLLTSSPAALAGVPIVTDEPAAEGLVELVAGRSGLPQDQLEVVPLRDLLDEPVQALGDGVLRRCARDPGQMSEVKTALARAEAALVREKDRDALDQLDVAVAAMGCLQELADPAAAGRIFQLRGALLATLGDEEAGRSELRTALGFLSEVSWKVTDPQEGRELAAAVEAEPRDHTVAASPPSLSSGPWLDGRVLGDAGAKVRPGLHLVQFATPGGIRSGWLVVGGDARLVLPMSYREPILGGILVEQSRGPVVDLVAATLPDFAGAYVAHEGGLWLVSEVDGELELSELVAPPAPEEEDEEPRKGKKGRKGRK